MELQEFTQFMKAKWQTIALFMVVFALIAFLVSLVQPQKYRSDQRFLVVAGYGQEVDPYAATRSTEYIANLLSEVAYSQDFMNQVTGAGFAVTNDLFPSLPKKRVKEWQKTIKTRVLGETGMIEISVYHEDRFITEQLALAVSHVLTTQHTKYHSRGADVTIQVIDQPITSLRPVEPNLILNTVLGFLMGLLGSLGFIYFFPKREVKIFGKKEYRLVQPREDVWSQPIATPAVTPAPAPTPAASAKPSMYESSDFKHPAAAREDVTEIGYQHPEAPENLPFG